MDQYPCIDSLTNDLIVLVQTESIDQTSVCIICIEYYSYVPYFWVL